MDDPYIDNTTERSMDEQTRKALELAREALFAPMNTTKFHQAIAAIDAALSAPVAQGEPVAWLKEWDSVGHARMGMRRVDLTPECETWLANMFPRITPLYAAPAPAHAAPVAPDPATVALIRECAAAFDEELAAYDIDPPIHHVKQGSEKCRAWLRAHGIGQGGAA